MPDVETMSGRAANDGRLDEMEVGAQIEFWTGLESLVGTGSQSMSSLTRPPATKAVRAPLPEDLQLREFKPLSASHALLDFGKVPGLQVMGKVNFLFSDVNAVIAELF